MEVDKVKILNTTSRWILPIVLVFFLSTSTFSHEEEQSASCYHVKSSPTPPVASATDDKDAVRLTPSDRQSYSAVMCVRLPACAFTLMVNDIVSQTFREYIRMNAP